MYGIGTVARLAQVSVRTLRHYDDVGLLPPAWVDPQTGYRYYTADQVHRLHRILVLRDLGVPLNEIGELLGDDVSIEQLRGILRLRQAEARARLSAQTEQLTRVEIRLAQLEEEPAMSEYEVIVKALDPVRLVGLTEDLTGPEQIAEAADRMYPRLHAALGKNGVTWSGLSYALYDDIDDASHPMRLTTALPITDNVTIDGDGLHTLELTKIDEAATTVVRGAPTKLPDAFEAVHQWIERAGRRASKHSREVYVDCDGPHDTWVTEVQIVLEPSGA